MTCAAAELCQIMGASGTTADRVAAAFTMLLPALCDRESPHEWDRKPLRNADGKPVIGEDGQPRTVKVFPEAWMRRLVKAHAAGAFERMDVSTIVERILTTEEAA